MSESVKTILMKRDHMSETDADNLLEEARADLILRVSDPEQFGSPFDFCEEWFGLELDYLDEFLF